MTTPARAHALVAKAKMSGELHPQPCEVCGAGKAIAHHDDYGKPLEVRWLCHRHHRLVHSNGPVDSILLRARITDAEARRLRVAAAERGEPIGQFVARCLARGFRSITGDSLAPGTAIQKGER